MTVSNTGTGLLFVISAPSGAGKTTLTEHAIGHIPGIVQSVSYTTRPRREGEEDGKPYIFVGKEEFEAMIEKDGLIEWARVHGDYYGTSRGSVEKAKEDKHDLILVIDVQGAASVKSKNFDAVFIFIMPPSMEVLAQRLRLRGTEDEAKVRERIENAKKEISQRDLYDHVIVNDDLGTAKKELEEIIRDERGKRNER